MKPRFETAAWLLCATSLAPAAAAQLGDTPETGDKLGSALAGGDFNADGIEDLAIGVPGESFTVFGFPSTTYTGAGAVHLVYGNPSGLTFAVSKLLKQSASTGSEPGLGSGNAFGSALACPDYDGDGFEDLAVGIPGQKVNGFAGAGAVQLFFITPLKLHAPVTFHQDYYGIADAAEANDAFGASLCVGDFDADGFMDLGVGSPGESFGSVAKTGVVHVIHGSPDGGVHPKSSFWVQGKAGLPDAPEASDFFGQSLAAGDLNADGFDDLAVGVPEEDLAFPGAGAVQVIYGSSVGLQAAANQFSHQDSPGILGDAEASDNFGTALVVADLDLDGIDDLSIGVPGDTITGVRAGSVNLLFGGTGGLTSTDNLQISQLDFSPFLETPEQNDRFGACLGLHADDGFVQLVVGVPGESLGAVTGAGTLQGFGVGPFRQVGSGFTMTFAFSPPEKGAALGSAVTTGDFNGDGYVDYGVGVPLKDFLAKDSGEVVIVLVAAAPFMEVLHQGN